MKKKELYYPSADGVTKIHAALWTPDTEAKGIIQISHGMTEYINSYDFLAEILTEEGYIVAGNDHLGHGESVYDKEYYGFFGKYEYLLADVHHLRQKLEKDYPGLPYIFWGNSMGSFVGRRYIQLYGKGMKGALFTGPGSVPEAKISILICGFISLTRGKRFFSKFIDNKDSYNDRIPDAKTKHDWLSQNEEYIKRYMADPYNNIQIKINGYYELSRLVATLQEQKNVNLIPKDLPIYLLGGSEDAVGKYGQYILEINDSYQKAGIKDAKYKIYEGMRHQLFFEPDNAEFIGDVLSWLDEKMNN